MTGADLYQGYGGLREEISQVAEGVWALLLAQTRGRVLAVDPDSDMGELVQAAYDAMIDCAAENSAGQLQSETLGQWTRTYRDTGRTPEQQQLTLLREYLGESGLLYRGWPL